MASSLERLASYLEHHDITCSVSRRDGYSEEQIQLLTRKGVFPYDYVDSLDRLEERNLPQKSDFKSKLNGSDISDEDYAHAMRVWNEFNISSLAEYSDLYLKIDVLLLADVFENFRMTCMDSYGLDPPQYFTTPGLTWDAMLLHTRVELELLTDIEMYMFVERGIRGGISQCSNRYAKANNRFMGEDYNPNKEESFLIYLDANNLYGWALSQYLPYKDFEWETELTSLDCFTSISDENDIGYILEVDLEYPEECHDEHKDLPLCPEHLAPPGSKHVKLMTTLYDKSRYVIHYRALKQALELGLRVKKIHRVLKFKQSPWLKPYVLFNTQKRTEAKTEFGKNFFKLMVNAVFGKTMENERKRVNVKIVCRAEKRYGMDAYVADPNFQSCTVIDENLVIIQMKQSKVMLRKPIYIGMSVLDVSKVHMYDFHYKKMLKWAKCKLLYTDTDSLIYEICGSNIYEFIKKNSEWFDTSNYPENNEYGIEKLNAKVVGLFKDECGGRIMKEFIGLRSKMYSILLPNQESWKKAKGVKTAVVEKTITFDDYRRCLFDGTLVKRNQNTIRSRKHDVFTEQMNKIALSPHDDKRCLRPNTTDTLPWGHESISLGKDISAEFEEEFTVPKAHGKEISVGTMENDSIIFDPELFKEFEKEFVKDDDEQNRVRQDVVLVEEARKIEEGKGVSVEELLKRLHYGDELSRSRDESEVGPSSIPIVHTSTQDLLEQLDELSSSEDELENASTSGTTPLQHYRGEGVPVNLLKQFESEDVITSSEDELENASTSASILHHRGRVPVNLLKQFESEDVITSSEDELEPPSKRLRV